MKIRVDFYKDTGKWHDGGIVDIGDTPGQDTHAVAQAIVDHQNIIGDGWQSESYFYVVVGNVDDNDDFCMRHFKPVDFLGLKRRV